MNNLQIYMFIHFQKLLNFHLEDVIKPLDEQKTQVPVYI